MHAIAIRNTILEIIKQEFFLYLSESFSFKSVFCIIFFIFLLLKRHTLVLIPSWFLVVCLCCHFIALIHPFKVTKQRKRQLFTMCATKCCYLKSISKQNSINIIIIIWFFLSFIKFIMNAMMMMMMLIMIILIVMVK